MKQYQLCVILSLLTIIWYDVAHTHIEQVIADLAWLTCFVRFWWCLFKDI